MKEYRFDDCDIGTNESFTVEVTESMMALFQVVSGDENPMHLDGEYAKGHGYENRLVYGMLTSSFYSRLVGMYLPGKYCILKSIEIFFVRPVYINDVLFITGRVKEKDKRFKQMNIKASMKNQHGKTISKADILVGFYE
jgi:enoyl-coA hydratase, R-specific